ncbi:hypothetical protein CHARACLAT_015874 [Characodon lateralis]|uniref:Uncharacterized protein n=1 Tax=Characodon lateralis TaxID=208331 RepID=A0ABU7E9Y4_9TELE|nr:hypothetical protein [Characodon lateralis]
MVLCCESTCLLPPSGELVLEFSGALDDRCLLSADCMEVYLSGRLPALRCQSVCLSGFYLRLCLPCWVLTSFQSFSEHLDYHIVS